MLLNEIYKIEELVQRYSFSQAHCLQIIKTSTSSEAPRHQDISFSHSKVLTQTAAVSKNIEEVLFLDTQGQI